MGPADDPILGGDISGIISVLLIFASSRLRVRYKALDPHEDAKARRSIARGRAWTSLVYLHVPISLMEFGYMGPSFLRDFVTSGEKKWHWTHTKYGQYLDGIAQQAGQESTSAQLVRMVKALAFMGVPGLLVLLSLGGFSTLTYLRKERSKSSDERKGDSVGVLCLNSEATAPRGDREEFGCMRR
jgi:hypothetical protein